MEGRNFYILTDHKSLTYALASHSHRHSPRQTDHLDQFTTDIRHIKGANNAVADALSRIGANALSENSPVIDFDGIAKAQLEDSELIQLQSTSSSLNLKAVPLATADTTIV